MKPGDRVQLHPATDAWMQGDRYGEIVKVTMRQQMPHRVHVRLDKSQRTVRLSPANIAEVLS